MSQRSPWTIPLCLAILLGSPLSAPGQDTRKAGDNSAAAQNPLDDVYVAPVIVDAETLFSVRGVTARPADRRAAEIADRIRSLAGNRKIDVASLTLEETSWVTWIRADGQHIMGLMDEDAALESTSRRALAELYRARIGEAIEAYRRRRQPGILWLHALQTLGATLALFLIAYVARFAIGRLRSLVEGHYRQRLEYHRGPRLPDRQGGADLAGHRRTPERRFGNGPDGAGLFLPELRAVPLPLDPRGRQRHVRHGKSAAPHHRHGNRCASIPTTASF